MAIMTRSPQTLREADRRLVAAWAADCAERVVDVFEAERPGDDRPRAAIARARAFANGTLPTDIGIRDRFGGGSSTADARSPAAIAACRAAGQASAVCHMGAHALGAAGYAADARRLAAPDAIDGFEDEIRWQLAHMSAAVRAALRTLPPLGENRSGPLGIGLLTRGHVGTAIRELQRAIADAR
ncbi:MAG: hypothetical protein PGN21_07140 [Sphingomonas paucimobilis]